MLKEAVKKFTYSLAGYTVATYVLVCMYVCVCVCVHVCMYSCVTYLSEKNDF